MARLLVVDDEPGMLAALRALVKSLGHEAVEASSGELALSLLDRVDAVITDFSMPGMDGVELLSRIRAQDAALPVILVTAHGSEKLAVRATRSGAYEYVAKPFDVDELGIIIERALEARRLRAENRRLVAERALGRNVVGNSTAIRRLLEATSRVAPRNVPVLVRGETGTGKELVAALLHSESPRASGPFVRFNCAAIPAELAEAELFGHARGAFTGATQARPGFFGAADGGTLVLDEVGELPIALQAMLLRALQDGEIQPVGSGRVEKVDVRVVACTNRDLAADVGEGRFRADLYYRLAVVELWIPPLRDRRDDIPDLAREFARRSSLRFGVEGLTLSAGLLERLRDAEWPGNVRQLENAVARLVAMSDPGELPASAFDAGAEPARSPRDDDAAAPESPAPSEGLSLREQLDVVERNLIKRSLAECSGNQSEAARRLGMSRSALISRLQKYGLG